MQIIMECAAFAFAYAGKTREMKGKTLEAFVNHPEDGDRVLEIMAAAVAMVAPALPYTLPRLAQIEWMGEAPKIEQNHTLVVTLDLGDKGPPRKANGHANIIEMEPAS
jgi:hypothetical protein